LSAKDIALFCQSLIPLCTEYKVGAIFLVRGRFIPLCEVKNYPKEMVKAGWIHFNTGYAFSVSDIPLWVERGVESMFVEKLLDSVF
jgi:hypothetical protein